MTSRAASVVAVFAIALAIGACQAGDRLERGPGDLDASTPPAEVVRVHIRAIAQGDFTGAYSLVSRDYRVEVPADDFDRQSAAYRGSSAEVGDASPDRAFPDARDVLVTLKRPDGSRVQLLYVLIREDDRWRIRGQEARPAVP